MTKNNIVNKRIDRILVPIDFSDYSLNACYFALHLSSKLGAEIKLFHAFFNPMIDAMAFPDAFTYQSNMADIFVSLEKSAKKETGKFVKKLKRYSKLKGLAEVSIKTEVISGQPGDEIRNVIKSFKPSLIVIGTRGHGEQSNEVLGSVATRVIDTSGVPVLLVTHDAHIRQEKLKILYVTNFDDSDYDAIQSLTTVLSGFEYEIKCVHFHTKTDKPDKEEKMSEMKRNISKNIELDCHIIDSDDVLSGLDSFVEKYDIDLIALTHRKRNLFYRIFNPGLAKKLLFKTKKPVFVFN